jgi:hypothetical protein
LPAAHILKKIYEKKIREPRHHGGADCRGGGVVVAVWASALAQVALDRVLLVARFARARRAAGTVVDLAVTGFSRVADAEMSAALVSNVSQVGHSLRQSKDRRPLGLAFAAHLNFTGGR